MPSENPPAAALQISPAGFGSKLFSTEKNERNSFSISAANFIHERAT
jgi:hypothetical protein